MLRCMQFNLFTNSEGMGVLITAFEALGICLVHTATESQALLLCRCLLQILLEGGDLLLLCGPSRYCYSHGIASVTQEVMCDGTQVIRGVRTSITLRRLLRDIVLSEDA